MAINPSPSADRSDRKFNSTKSSRLPSRLRSRCTQIYSAGRSDVAADRKYLSRSCRMPPAEIAIGQQLRLAWRCLPENPCLRPPKPRRAQDQRAGAHFCALLESRSVAAGKAAPRHPIGCACTAKARVPPHANGWLCGRRRAGRFRCRRVSGGRVFAQQCQPLIRRGAGGLEDRRPARHLTRDQLLQRFGRPTLPVRNDTAELQ